MFEDGLIVAFFVTGLMALFALPAVRRAALRAWRAQRFHQSGNVFLILFGAVILLGGVGNVLTKIISGPAQGVGTITRHALSETDLANAAKIIGASARATVGDCDGDDMIEPLPWRDPAGAPAPVGGGLVPEGTPAPTRDQWKRPIGYCAWDHGSATVTDNVAGCGGNAANRLGGGDLITEYVIALISAGADGAFQTTCRAFVDANNDGVPDQPLVQKAPGSDDIVLAYTYGELFAAGEGGTTGNIGPQPDEACTPETAGLLRDEMDTIQVCTSDGWEEVGASITGSGNFTPVTGAPLNSAHTSTPISFTGFYGTRLATVEGGAIIEINGNPVGASAQVAANDVITLVANAAATPETERVFTFSISSIIREWRITTRDRFPAALSISPSTSSGMNVAGPGSPAYGTAVSFTVTNTGEADSAPMQAAVLSNTTHFEFYVGGGHLGDNCNGRTLAGGGTCQIAVRPRASNDGAYNGTLGVSDAAVSASATLSGTASGWNCTVASGTTWTVGSKICTVPSNLVIAHGSTGTATDSTAPTTGSATYSCSGGTATLQGGATCVEGCTVEAGTTWTVAGKICTVPSALGVAHGGTGTATDSIAPTTGSATYTCNNGSTTLTSSSCVESCSANQTVSWSSNCSALSGAILANGANRTITNTASGYTGTRVITCNNGTLAQSGGSCATAVTPGSQNYASAGSFTFVVPAYNTLTVRVWGGGGGGSSCKTVRHGSAGGNSSWNNAVFGNGGQGGTGGGQPGAGGTASGGTTNTSGSAGSGTNGGTGGTAGGPGGGTGGVSSSGGGANGSAPGGGGSGAKRSGCTSRPGGGGGYATRTYSAGALTPGSAVSVVVGASGPGGVRNAYHGGDGAVGRVTITWN